MCLVCFGSEAPLPATIETARPESAVAPEPECLRRTTGPKPRPPRGRYAGDAVRERTAYRRRRLGLLAGATTEEVDAAWQVHRTERHGASWLDEPVTLAAEDS